ncbi:MAG: MATE family efflux transporter [Roseobacter sp.]|jgi:MATE family multidrug resistance protein|nr:MATE family efflux transporter [Roseobacter sp.]
MSAPAPLRSPKAISTAQILPTWITRAGLRFLLITDVLVVASFAPSYLAPFGLAYSIGAVLFAVSQGLLLGCLTLTVAALARDRTTSVAEILRDGLVFGIACSLMFALVCQFGADILRMLGQDPDVSQSGGWIMGLMALGLPLHYAYVALGYGLEAIGLHKVVAAWVALGFMLNLGLGIGIPTLLEMNAEMTSFVVAFTTVLVRLGMLLGLILFILRTVDLRRYGACHLPKWNLPSGTALRKVGWAAGTSLAVESAAFASLSVFAGWISPTALAAYTLLNNLVSLIFSLALAVAVVTSAQVAAANAMADRAAARASFCMGLGLALTLMTALGGAAFVYRNAFINFSSSDPAAVALAIPLVGLVSVLMLGDGGQVVASNALRGLGDTWSATLIHLGCYLILMVGGGWLMSIPFERGVRGLLEATAVASFTVLIALSWRFFRLTAQR